MASHLDEKKTTDNVEYEKLMASQVAPRKYEILYHIVLQLIVIHLSGLYGLYLCFTSARWPTIFFNVVLHAAALLGVTAGVHRLWCHRAYKATTPLQVLLMLFHCLAYQDHAVRWARDHRVHHKYSDTDADPYNAKRGFFFSHIGWLVVKKHPEVIKKGKTIQVKDLYDNPVLQFQAKHYYLLTSIITFILPTVVPMYFWGESLNNAFNLTTLRVIAILNTTFLVNSAAHRYGYKPYDGQISPTQSIPLSLATLGECFHNYHHVFPFDYRTGELGNNYINFTTKFIDFFAWIGWAYDLKSASDKMIRNRAKRTGDGSDLWGRGKKDFKNEACTKEPNIWGWGDEDLSEADKESVLLLSLGR